MFASDKEAAHFDTEQMDDLMNNRIFLGTLLERLSLSEAQRLQDNLIALFEAAEE